MLYYFLFRILSVLTFSSKFFSIICLISYFFFCSVPIRGTASDVVGMDSATRFRNTVKDRSIVTPAIRDNKKRKKR